MLSYYEILEIQPDADIATIKAAYRRMVKKYHPDKVGNNAVNYALFRSVQEAYEVLSNEKKRQEYEQINTAYYTYNNKNFQSLSKEELLRRKLRRKQYEAVRQAQAMQKKIEDRDEIIFRSLAVTILIVSGVLGCYLFLVHNTFQSK